jgi:acetyl esterase/lipase
MKIYLKSFCIILLSIAIISCKKSKKEQTSAEAKTMLNVSYSSNNLQTMDVYLPANRNTDTKVVVLIHGGSFISGDKTDYNLIAQELVKNNFAVININYRLVDASGLQTNPVTHKQSTVLVQHQVDDVSMAVDYAITHADEWQISKSRIAIVGHSAGATLGLLYSYSAKNANKVKVVANLAGALDQTFTDIPSYNLLPPYILELGYRYTGFEVNIANEQHYKAISPLYTATADKKIPTLNIFPENNAVGDLPKQGRSTFDAFTAKLNQVGVPNKFVQIAGADHSFTRAGNLQAVFIELLTYLNANL